MTDTGVRQRLAVILAADVAGYSLLMAVDERATVAALDAARSVFRAQIESRQGRVIDMAGDSVLAVFETATGAVAGALAIQGTLTAMEGAAPQDRRMRFRIGIHLGDVIEKPDGTVYGDGVNIAARLEGLAEPGGITVSEGIQVALRNRVAAAFEDQGEQQVKNISHPVRAFRVRGANDAVSKPRGTAAEPELALPDKSSIAGLPFANMSGDPEQEYAADGMVEDVITALSRFRRQQAEVAIREIEQRFRAVADQAPVMMWLSDSSGEATFVNSRWLTFTGQTMEQATGHGWTEAVHPDCRRDCLATYLDAFHARRTFQMEYRLRRADGEYAWVLATGAAHHAPDGTFTGYVGTCVDVSEVKEARHALAESTELRSAIFGSLYGQIAALDAKGVIIALNEAWTESAKEAGADPSRTSIGVDYLEVCRKAGGDVDAERALEAIESVLEGRVARASLEYRCPTPTEERWFEMVVEPLRRPEGGAVVSHIDITARRRAEEEARRQRDELAHALRLTTLGEMTASLSHELNQPLAAIMASAEASLRLLDGPETWLPDVREALHDIVSDSRRASQVIQRLRALFRKDRSEQRPIAINGLVTEVVGVVRGDAERRQVNMHLVLADGLPPVRADAVQIQQVILNLLVNAIEAMAGVEGPRELTIETLRREAGIVEVVVRDTGVGVDASQLDRMFEPFVSSKTQGLGMGLSISRSIIRAHGGRISATRNAGPGIAIRVELPCEEPG